MTIARIDSALTAFSPARPSRETGPYRPLTGSYAGFADCRVSPAQVVLTIGIEVEAMKKTWLGPNHTDLRKMARTRMDWEGLALPLVLMLTGIVLLIGSWVGVFSLDRIQNLWPGAIIVIGLAEWMRTSGEDESRAASDTFDSGQKKNYHVR